MRGHEMKWRCGVMVLVIAGLGGCITVPDVVLVENKTALEKQAAGEFRSLETQLQGAGIKGGPEHITGSQLNQKKVDLRESTLGEIELFAAPKSWNAILWLITNTIKDGGKPIYSGVQLGELKASLPIVWRAD